MLLIAYKSSNKSLTKSYISLHLLDNIEHNFEVNWVAVSNIMRSQYFELQTLASTFSSVGTRSLLRMNNISVQLRGDELFVSPCTIESTYYLRNKSNC